MRPDPTVARQANWAQYEPARRAGHYESFYQRANDPGRPLAFWIRYTVFSRAGRPADAVGELGSFLEVATATNRIGPVGTPPITLMVLRHGGKEHLLVSMAVVMVAFR